MSKFLQLISESTPSDVHSEKQKAVRYLTAVINNLAETGGESDIQCTFDVFDDAINVTVHDVTFKLKLTQVGRSNVSDEMSEDDETSTDPQEDQSVTNSLKRVKDLTGAAEALTGGAAVRKRLFGTDPVSNLAKVKGDLANRITQGISAEISKLRI